jgi:hypothetical protein
MYGALAVTNGPIPSTKLKVPTLCMLQYASHPVDADTYISHYGRAPSCLLF